MTKRIWILATTLAFTAIAHAATNDLTGLLQKGLFEEEADRNLEAAISNYQSLANAFDKDRQVAATAIFRLGECYRKLGRTNEAAAQYERIVRDFSDQQTLVTLSQQNLTGLGAAQNPSAAANPVIQQLMQQRQAELGGSDTRQQLQTALVTEKVEYEKRSTMLRLLKKLRPEELKNALPTVVQDPELNALLSQLDKAEQDFLEIKGNYGAEHPHYQTARELVNDLQRKVDDRINGIMAGLQTQLDASQAHQDWLEHEIRSAADSTAAQPANKQLPITDEEEKEIRRIQQIIQNSPDLINTASDQSGGLTPLGYAAAMDWLRVAGFLLDHGAKVDAAPGGNTPLLGAALHANKGMVELLLSREADVNAKAGSLLDAEMFGQTALHIAAAKGFLAVAETLLDHNADVNARDGRQRTPLHLASVNARVEIIKFLLAHGADVNAKGEEDATPLSDAVHSKSLEAVNVILATKPELDAVDKSGRTSLAIAAASGSVDIVKTLLAAKADPNAGSKNLPLFGAVKSGSTNITALLLRAGADPNKVAPVELPYYKNPQDRSAIQMAVNNKEAAIVKLLLDYGGDANTNYGPGSVTLLMVAAGGRDAETAKALLAKGADPNASDGYGNTGLHYAIGFSRSLEDYSDPRRGDVIKFLLENHANPNVQNKNGKTPLDLLKEKIGQNAFISSPDRISDQKALARELADLLRAHGALDDLPNWSGIEITRPSTGFSEVVFHKGTNDANRFSLLELLAVQYQFLSGDPGGGSRNHGNEQILAMNDTRLGALPFPDLAHVHIRRPDSGGKKWTEQTIDVKQLLESVNCSNDVSLHWGDRVEIPESDHPLNEQWRGFGVNALNTFQTCLSRQVQVAVKGENHDLKLQPDIALGTADVTINRPFWILPVLRESNLLLTSSDLSRIKVTRRDATTGKTTEWPVDCSNPQSPPNFWLRDGDVINVPEKAEQ